MANKKVIAKQMWLAQLSYVFSTGLVLYAKSMGALHLSWPQIIGIIALYLVGQAVFFALVVSGWSLRLRDAGMTLAQIAFSLTVHMPYLYVLDANMRGMFLMIMCFSLIFATNNLAYRSAFALATYASVYYLVIIAAQVAFSDRHFSVEVEVLTALVFVGFCFWLAVYAGYGYSMRVRLSERRKALMSVNQQLMTTQAELFDSAHRAGMADLAADVLHHVGNALNHVNTSGHLIHKGIRDMKLEPLSRATRLFEDHQSDLPSFITSDQGTKLLKMLTLLNDSLVRDQSNLLHEAEALHERVERVVKLVAAQGMRTAASTKPETLELDVFVSDCLSQRQPILAESGVDLDMDLRSHAWVAVVRHRFQRVILDFVIDSCRSFEEHHQRSERLISVVTSSGQGDAILKLMRSGPELETLDVQNLFAQVPEARSSNSHSLHDCANSIHEMASDFHVDAGENGGICLTIQLPLVEPTGPAAGGASD